MHKDIGLFDQLTCNRHTFRRFQINRHATLITVCRRVVVTHRIMKIRRPDTAIVTRDRALYLDDICSIVAQQHAAKWARHCNADFNNFNAG
jgi:hypothetical protein